MFVNNYCYGLNCVSMPTRCVALTPIMTIFGNRASREIIKVKWGHDSGTLIGLMSLLERGRDKCAQRKSHVNTQREGNNLQARKRCLTKPIQLAPWSLDAHPPELWTNTFLWFKPPRLISITEWYHLRKWRVVRKTPPPCFVGGFILIVLCTEKNP